MSLDGTLKDEKSFGEAEHALKTLLVVKQSNLRRRNHIPNSPDKDRLALAKTQLTNRPQCVVPFLFKRLVVRNLVEAISFHQAKIGGDVGKGALGLLCDEPALEHLVDKSILTSVLRCIFFGELDLLSETLGKLRLGLLRGVLGHLV